MALHDVDTKRTTIPPAINKHAPLAANKYIPFVIGAVVLAAFFFLAFGDSISNRTTLPPEITTTPVHHTPAIK
jgi:hypothetical protein